MDPIHPPFCWECRPCLDLLCPRIVSCPALVKQTAERLRADRQTLRTAWKILFHGTACASHAVALRLGKGKKKEKKGLINVGRLKPGKNFVLCFLGMHGSHCGLGAGTRHSGIFCLPLVGCGSCWGMDPQRSSDRGRIQRGDGIPTSSWDHRNTSWKNPPRAEGHFHLPGIPEKRERSRGRHREGQGAH